MGQRSGSGHRRVRSKIGIAALVAGSCFGTLSISSGATAAPSVAATAAPMVATAASRVRLSDPVAALALEAVADMQTYMAARMGDTSSLTRYQATRDQIATELANRLGIDPMRMISAWQNADVAHQLALMAAFTQLGVPYRRNTSKVGEGFDCSGLTTYAWGVAGTTITRQSGAQIREAASRTKDTAMAGDLAYYPGHVMMWLGVDTAIVHSPYTGRNVEVDYASKRRTLRFGNPIG